MSECFVSECCVLCAVMLHAVCCVLCAVCCVLCAVCSNMGFSSERVGWSFCFHESSVSELELLREREFVSVRCILSVCLSVCVCVCVFCVCARFFITIVLRMS
ncbi:MAG TPA: hypothetical protein V6C97_00555 [Oculatellaceae cyanobacterium]